jgi:hypothetical protein
MPNPKLKKKPRPMRETRGEKINMSICKTQTTTEIHQITKKIVLR